MGTWGTGDAILEPARTHKGVGETSIEGSTVFFGYFLCGSSLIYKPNVNKMGYFAQMFTCMIRYSPRYSDYRILSTSGNPPECLFLGRIGVSGCDSPIPATSVHPTPARSPRIALIRNDEKDSASLPDSILPRTRKLSSIIAGRIPFQNHPRFRNERTIKTNMQTALPVYTRERHANTIQAAIFIFAVLLSLLQIILFPLFAVVSARARHRSWEVSFFPPFCVFRKSRSSGICPPVTTRSSSGI